jgi:hypothetical protein
MAREELPIASSGYAAGARSLVDVEIGPIGQVAIVMVSGQVRNTVEKRSWIFSGLRPPAFAW